MKSEWMHALERLRQRGWNVEVAPQRQTLNAAVLERYAWVPSEIIDFVCETKIVVSPDERAWLLTAPDFNPENETGFAWNAWELLSLQCADKLRDKAWAAEAQEFWDKHFPILTSLKSGYAYFAVESGSLRIAVGIEPEFEAPTLFAEDFSDFLNRLADGDSDLDIYI